MSCSLNSLKGVKWGTIKATITRDIKGDIQSIDYSSHEELFLSWFISYVAVVELGRMADCCTYISHSLQGKASNAH